VAIFRSFFGGGQVTEVITSALDLVTTVAGLASNPKKIDPLLDKVRAISAQLAPGGLVSEKEESSLFDVYLEIERYLMTSDPIRIFSQQELRGKASKGLLARLEVYEAKGNKV
jgi:hypothetical protein